MPNSSMCRARKGSSSGSLDRRSCSVSETRWRWRDSLPTTRCATIATIDAVDADAVVATSIDGHRAYELRFRTTASVPLFGGDDGTFTIEEGTHRLLALNIEGTLVLIVDDVTVRSREPVDALVQGVIDSVRFDPVS